MVSKEIFHDAGENLDRKQLWENFVYADLCALLKKR